MGVARVGRAAQLATLIQLDLREPERDREGERKRERESQVDSSGPVAPKFD